MSIIRKTFKEGSWLALFRFISQLFSWSITIFIARILSSDDYGLMAISYVIIGYAMMFSEMGLGAAIIQRSELTREELSSLFWFSVGFSFILFTGCFIAAYPAAVFFHEPMVTPIMQVISVTFILSGCQIVPSSLLRKNLEFKTFGKIDLIVTVIACLSMLIIALMGGGVWALVAGHIIRSVVRLILIFIAARWLPEISFNFQKAKSYIKFGMIVTLSRSLFYISENSDTFIAGRAWSANILGYYSFALQLSKIPMERIISLIHSVSFPLFSGLQNDKEKFNAVYVNLIKFIATIVFPLYVGGYLIGGELVKVLLDEKWLPMTLLFRCLCLVQIITALSAINNRVNTAQGRPHWGAWYHGISAVLMPISFYFAVQHGMKAILIPWFTTYIITNVVWTIVTIKKLDITVFSYLKSLFKPLIATLLMTLVVQLISSYSMIVLPFELDLISGLIIKIVVGAAIYVGYLWFFDREFFDVLRDLRSK